MDKAIGCVVFWKRNWVMLCIHCHDQKIDELNDKHEIIDEYFLYPTTEADTKPICEYCNHEININLLP